MKGPKKKQHSPVGCAFDLEETMLFVFYYFSIKSMTLGLTID